MDVLDLVIPEPARVAGLVFGESGSLRGVDDVAVGWNGHALAHVWDLDTLDVDYRLPSLVTELRGCVVLRVDREVIEAARAAHRDDVRSAFSLEEALLAVLTPQPYWYVWCEREVDTQPLLKRALTLEECVAAAVARVLDEPESFDFVAWPHERVVQRRIDWSGEKRLR